MLKNALCVFKEDMPPAFSDNLGLTMDRIVASVMDLAVTLEDRATCETDESLLQILPYMTLVRDAKVFTYSRGGAGGEGRLHGKLSVGVGGHVDIFPAHGQSLLALLQDEAAREFQEEVGLPLAQRVTFTHTLYDSLTPVGRVHLGLHCLVEMDTQDLALEEGVLEHGEWLTMSELLSPDKFMRLEPWSRLVVMHLSTKLLLPVGVLNATTN